MSNPIDKPGEADLRPLQLFFLAAAVFVVSAGYGAHVRSRTVRSRTVLRVILLTFRFIVYVRVVIEFMGPTTSR